jgi:hypothetical protein
MRNLSRLAAGLVLAAGLNICLTAQNPTAAISNGQVKATLYLPDSKNGFYRGSRFDWSGVVSSLQYAGHSYYGPWFERSSPEVNDFIYDGDAIVAGPCTSIMGVPEEFSTNRAGLGYDEAKVGGTFIKIGVGVLRKPDDRPYSMFRLYEIVDNGKWTVHTASDSVEFIQELADPASGYAYVYSKRVSLTPGKPQMVLEHRLRNTGKRTIQTSVYNHNFMRLDNQAPGPDLVFKTAFQPQASGPQPGTPQPGAPPAANPVEIHGNQIALTKTLSGKERVMVQLSGFGTDSKDYDFRIENRKLGFGLRITSDRPLSRAMIWGIRSVIAVEPFNEMTIEPGSEFTWKTTYDYYTFPKDPM